MHQESTTERHQVAGQGPQPVHWNENKDGGRFSPQVPVPPIVDIWGKKVFTEN